MKRAEKSPVTGLSGVESGAFGLQHVLGRGEPLAGAGPSQAEKGACSSFDFPQTYQRGLQTQEQRLTKHPVAFQRIWDLSKFS